MGSASLPGDGWRGFVRRIASLVVAVAIVVIVSGVASSESVAAPRGDVKGDGKGKGRSRSAAQPRADPPRFTSLKVSSPEILVYERAGARQIRYVSVRVLNIGRAEARGIDVSYQVGEGLAFPLKGPRRLLVRGGAVYSGSPKLPAELGSGARVIAVCATCR